MKKFKVEKSRSTLWREAQKDVPPVDYECSSYAEYDPVESCYGDTHTSHRMLYDDVASSSSNNRIPVSGQLLLCDNEVGWRWFQESESDSGESGDEGLETECDVSHKLAEWVTKYNISRAATQSLLSVLHPYLPSLPLDQRTLTETLSSASYTARPISGGEYCHFGLANGILSKIQQTCASVDSLALQINVDGIPLFKSSSTTLWPILCSVRSSSSSTFMEPFVVGIFCGKEKPGSAAEFMYDFVTEACQLMSAGLIVGDKTIQIGIHSFVCDAPARAFLKGIKSHSGYSSCEKCTIQASRRGQVFTCE